MLNVYALNTHLGKYVRFVMKLMPAQLLGKSMIFVKKA